MSWTEEVLAFWFGLSPEQWFKPDAELDQACRERFAELWEEQAGRLPETFLGSPREALAAVILFDQLPRNMFRGHADQFATDHLALAIAKGAIERGYDDQLTPEQRVFLYLPFEHSEDLGDQQRSVALFTALGDPQKLDFARKHHDVIARYGRFPHRNRVLGRTPRPGEPGLDEPAPW
jgi:uncharacterized protein (DUF924 family)